MARMTGVAESEAGIGLRFLYWFTRRKLAKVAGLPRVPEPIRLAAHHPRLLRATAHMEMGQEAARLIPGRLKLLASIQCARLVGCPF